MHPFDHILVLWLAVAQPALSALTFRRFVAAGADMNRVRLYDRTLIIQWLTLGVTLIGWLVLGRSAAGLGLVVPAGWGFRGGAAAVLLLVTFLLRLWRNARRLGEAERSKAISKLGKLVHFLPRTVREYRRFVPLSVTAGIVEEIVYRGFLLWYFASHLPLWAAVIASSAIFGIGHSYQGPAAALRTGLVGLALAVLYVVSGSIWLPIVAHAAVDLLQGATVFEILRHGPDALPDERPRG